MVGKAQWCNFFKLCTRVLHSLHCPMAERRDIDSNIYDDTHSLDHDNVELLVREEFEYTIPSFCCIKVRLQHVVVVRLQPDQ